MTSARDLRVAGWVLYVEFDRWRVRVGNMVDPNYTLGASILKSIVGLAQ